MSTEAPAAAEGEPSPPQPQPEDQPSDSHPPFDPLFTLLQNTTTNTTRHPKVRYIFADDEPEILPSKRSILIDLEHAPASLNPTPSTHPADSTKPADPAEPKGRWQVKSASSLDKAFAITEAKIEEGHQLRILGVQREAVPPLSRSKEALAKKSKESLTRRSKESLRGKSSKESLNRSKDGRDSVGEDNQALLEDIRRRMGVLKMVVEQGGRSAAHLYVGDGGQQKEEGQGDEQPVRSQGGSGSVEKEKEKDQAEDL